MGPSPRTCEIVELREELGSAQNLKETNPLSRGQIMHNKPEKFLMQKREGKYTLEDDINKLFEEIDLRASARALRPSHQLSADSLQKSVSKKPIRGGVSPTSGIGISESVTLKQALRGLCISHASEVAAMKRLSKSMMGSSRVSEAGTIKRLYRAVVVEANKSSLSLDEGKESLLEISLVPGKGKLKSSEKMSMHVVREKSLSSIVHPSPQFAVAEKTEVSMIRESQEEEIGPVLTETGRHASTLNLGQEGELSTAELTNTVSVSMECENRKTMRTLRKNLKLNCLPPLLSKVNKSSNGSACVVKPVPKNRKMKKASYTSSNTCNADESNGMSPSTSKLVSSIRDCNQNVTTESPPAISSGCLNVRECSRSREPADFSHSSKSSVGEYSNISTCVSEESHMYGSSCSGSRPHMSKDLRWDAVRRVEMQHGSLGLRHFKLLKRLGCGDVGTVYLAELIGTNCPFAVKIMDTNSLASKKKMSRAQTERDVLQLLDHPFLPTLYAHFTTNKFSILIMEYCPGGDLHILRQKQPGRIFSEHAARFYVAEVLLALEYLHMLGIVYRDLKPENILVREDGHIMLCDFDLSLRCTVKPTLVQTSSSLIAPTSCICHFCFTPRAVKPNTGNQVPQLLAEPTSARSNSFVGTHEYLAPEIIRGQGHGNGVDWWTFGIFLYELMFGTTPFKGLGNDETLANVVMHSIKFPESPCVSSEAKDLVRGLLIKDPRDRLGSVKGAGEIRQHPFFEGLNWALIRCAAPPILPKPCDVGVVLLASEESKLVEYRTAGEEHPEFELF